MKALLPVIFRILLFIIFFQALRNYYQAIMNNFQAVQGGLYVPITGIRICIALVPYCHFIFIVILKTFLFIFEFLNSDISLSYLLIYDFICH